MPWKNCIPVKKKKNKIKPQKPKNQNPKHFEIPVCTIRSDLLQKLTAKISLGII